MLWGAWVHREQEAPFWKVLVGDCIIFIYNTLLIFFLQFSLIKVKFQVIDQIKEGKPKHFGSRLWSSRLLLTSEIINCTSSITKMLSWLWEP